MTEYAEGSSWWRTTFPPKTDVSPGPGSYARVRRVEAGYVHFAYSDETDAGSFYGRDTLSAEEFAATFAKMRTPGYDDPFVEPLPR